MGMLEEQLAALESVSEASSAVGSSGRNGRTRLSDLFSSTSSSEGGSVSSSKSRNLKESQTRTQISEIESSSNPLKTYSETGTGNDKAEEESTSEVDESEGWGAFSLGNPKLSLGAIPSYCLGLGAGVGFIILSEVVQRVARR